MGLAPRQSRERIAKKVRVFVGRTPHDVRRGTRRPLWEMPFHLQLSKPATGHFSLKIISLFSSTCSISYVAQELHNSFAGDIAGNDSDSRVKNRAGIDDQWNLR